MSESVSSKKVKPAKIVLWSLLGAVLLFVCIALGSLLVQKYIKKSSVPMFAGLASLIVTTGSMNGTINEGDLIIIKKTDDYKLGDIVTFVTTKGAEPITHRIVNYGPEEGTFVTKGDANNTLDIDIGPISVDQIAGEVVLTIPKVGFFLEWFLYEGGLIYLIAMVAIAVAAVYLWNAMKPEPEAVADASENGDNPQEELSSEAVADASKNGDNLQEELSSEAVADASKNGDNPQEELSSKTVEKPKKEQSQEENEQ